MNLDELLEILRAVITVPHSSIRDEVIRLVLERVKKELEEN